MKKLLGKKRYSLKGKEWVTYQFQNEDGTGDEDVTIPALQEIFVNTFEHGLHPQCFNKDDLIYNEVKEIKNESNANLSRKRGEREVDSSEVCSEEEF